DFHVTGVQTCALPISRHARLGEPREQLERARLPRDLDLEPSGDLQNEPVRDLLGRERDAVRGDDLARREERKTDHADRVLLGPRQAVGLHEPALGVHPERLGGDQGPVHVPQDGGGQVSKVRTTRSSTGHPQESRLGRMTDDETAPLGREPLVIAAFEGWNDAGSAATSALHHLHEVWGAEIVDALDPEEFHDFQVNRPVVGFDPETGQRRISWPTTHFATLRTPVLDRHVVLVHGIEPSLRWRTYSRELLDIASRLGAGTLVTLGAL